MPRELGVLLTSRVDGRVVEQRGFSTALPSPSDIVQYKYLYTLGQSDFEPYEIIWITICGDFFKKKILPQISGNKQFTNGVIFTKTRRHVCEVLKIFGFLSQGFHGVRCMWLANF